MALFSSGPASCNVLRPAFNETIRRLGYDAELTRVYPSFSNVQRRNCTFAFPSLLFDDRTSPRIYVCHKYYLKRDGVVALLITVLQFLLLALLESSEVILDQEGGVEFAHGHFVVA